VSSCRGLVTGPSSEQPQRKVAARAKAEIIVVIFIDFCLF